ncbi:hypothetical protein [Streptomyces sp900116325]|uniref:hypothetical protein n=1 Tax=Streptomyces sp. 900116325 TaxID=3154295 RepID=UPI0033B928A7
MIKNQAGESSLKGKPAMVYVLATTLTVPEDVPQQLRDIFAQLQELAPRPGIGRWARRARHRPRTPPRNYLAFVRLAAALCCYKRLARLTT